MSDKFFFKGRQDARQSYSGRGFETKAKQRIGTKKFPLELVVTSEVKKLEIEKQLEKEGLYANIIIDHSEKGVESIVELTSLLAKTPPVRSAVEAVPARNEACLCGSGKKYKKCCA